MECIQQLANGLSAGAVYAMIAIGYSLVFGVLRLINFAHCDIMMIGAYAGYICTVRLNMPVISAIIASSAVCALAGLVSERLCYRPLRGTKGMPVLVTAIGLSLFLEYAVMLVFGAGARAYPQTALTGGVVHIFGAAVPFSKLTALMLAVAATAGLQLMLTKTKRGRAMRAVADDFEAARLCGINRDKSISLAFAAGSALAGAAGVIYGAMYVVSPMMGVMPGLKAFAAAVVGGIGSIPGAVLGGFALGLAETLSGAVFSTAFKDVVSFGLMTAFLILRPAGLINSAGARRC